MWIGNGASKHNILDAGSIQRACNTSQKTRTYDTSSAVMDQNFRSAKLLDKVSNLTLSILSENYFGGGIVLEIKHGLLLLSRKLK